MSKTKIEQPVRYKPLARFYYQGNHSHPVRRTIIITAETRNLLIGYELREGSVVRDTSESLNHHKSYLKSEIIKWGDYPRLMRTSKNWHRRPDESTLQRLPLMSLFQDGA